MWKKYELYEGEIVDKAIAYAKDRHPTPWRVEAVKIKNTSTFAIIDASGNRVCKAGGSGQAPLHLIVDLVNDYLV